MIRVIIAGSRTFNDYPFLESKLDFLFSKAIERGEEIIIISGKAKGADSLGERYALDRGFSVEEYPAEWERYGKSAGYRRNVQMAEVATHLVAFWDGQCRGTKHMIDIANERNLIVRVITY